MRGPQLELRIAVGSQPREIVVTARKQVNPGKRLRVTPVEAFGQPDDRRQHPHRRAETAVQIAVSLVGLLRSRLAMVAGDERNDLDFLWVEAAQISILDQVIRMPVVPIVADVYANVVQQRRVFEPLSLTIRETVHAAGLIEDAERQAGHLLSMLGPIAATFAQLDDTPAPDVRIAFDFPDARAVSVNVVEHQAFAQCQIAQDQVFGPKPPQNRVEKHRAGNTEIGAARIQAGDVEPFFDVCLNEPFSQPMDGFRADTLVSDVLWRRSLFFRNRKRPETEDRSRCANHPVEACLGDLFEVAAHLLVQVFDQAAFVVR